MNKSSAGRKAELSDIELFDAIIAAHGSNQIDIQNSSLSSNEVRERVFAGHYSHTRVKAAMERARTTVHAIWSSKLPVVSLQNQIGEDAVRELITNLITQLHQLINTACTDANNICEQLQNDQINDKFTICKLKERITTLEEQLAKQEEADFQSIILLP